MSVARRLAGTVPAIRQLRTGRDALLAERDALLADREAWAREKHEILSWRGSPLFTINAMFDAEATVRRHAAPDLAPRAGLLTNFIGVVVDPARFPGLLDGRAGQVEAIPIPGNWHADLAEWAAVLRAVELSGGIFRMVELGCGWGCWMANAASAARTLGKSTHAIGVEGDESVLATTLATLAVNGFPPERITLRHGIAAARDGVALFPRQDRADPSYGLEPVFGASEQRRRAAVVSGSHDEVPMLALSDVIAGERVDLVHIDIQGGEADLVAACIEALSAHVAYLVVGTHSRPVEGRLFEILLGAGWRLEIERTCFLRLENATPLNWLDGVQGWRNPALLPITETP